MLVGGICAPQGTLSSCLCIFPDFLEDITVDPAIVDKLTHGTLALFLPNLQKAKGSLNEVL